MAPTGFRGKRALLGGSQIAIDGAPAQLEAPSSLGLRTALLDEFDHPFSQLQRISFHARKPITLCANVNIKCYSLGQVGAVLDLICEAHLAVDGQLGIRSGHRDVRDCRRGGKQGGSETEKCDSEEKLLPQPRIPFKFHAPVVSLVRSERQAGLCRILPATGAPTFRAAAGEAFLFARRCAASRKVHDTRRHRQLVCARSFYETKRLDSLDSPSVFERHRDRRGRSARGAGVHPRVRPR